MPSAKMKHLFALAVLSLLTIGTCRMGLAQGDLSTEARGICGQALALALLQQGDSWFEGHKNPYSSSPTIVQYHRLTKFARPLQLSSADTANGVDVNGYGYVTADLYRVYTNGVWGAWTNSTTSIFQCGPITHTNGQWNKPDSDGGLTSVPGDVYKPSIGDVPPL